MMDKKGMVFTTDLLLAMIVVTIAIGFTINEFEILNYQLQDFTGRQSLERITNDAADYLVKTSGNPNNWEQEPEPDPDLTLPGLAYPANLGSQNNYLDPRKVNNLKNNPQLVSQLLNGSTKFYLNITRADDNSPIIQIFMPGFSSSDIANAQEVAVANRTVVLPTNQTSFAMNDLFHMNPGHPGESQFLWYLKGGDGIYVGPGNVATYVNPNASFYVDNDDLANYDYYIYIEENKLRPGGSGQVVRSAFYGFSDGDSIVVPPVNQTPLDSKDRDDAVKDELKRIYGGGGWQNFPKLDQGTLINVNSAIQTAKNAGAGPDLKLWISVKSNPDAIFSIALLQVYKGQSPFERRPAKLVLMVWE